MQFTKISIVNSIHIIIYLVVLKCLHENHLGVTKIVISIWDLKWYCGCWGFDNVTPICKKLPCTYQGRNQTEEFHNF